MVWLNQALEPAAIQQYAAPTGSNDHHPGNADFELMKNPPIMIKARPKVVNWLADKEKYVALLVAGGNLFLIVFT